MTASLPGAWQDDIPLDCAPHALPTQTFVVCCCSRQAGDFLAGDALDIIQELHDDLTPLHAASAASLTAANHAVAAGDLLTAVDALTKALESAMRTVSPLLSSCWLTSSHSSLRLSGLQAGAQLG